MHAFKFIQKTIPRQITSFTSFIILKINFYTFIYCIVIQINNRLNNHFNVHNYLYQFCIIIKRMEFRD